MALGIIANPASGKDIRRLVAYATVIDNNEKVNIVKRIVLAAQAVGVKEIYIMPDVFRIGFTVIETLTLEEKLNCQLKVLEMAVTNTAADTSAAAAIMEAQKMGCVIVLGGDGTSRAAAKELLQTPILPVSTGTNNVYPEMTEGTIVGLAGAVVEQTEDTFRCCTQDKRIEVYKDGKMIDIALVDAVISVDTFTGTRAIWHTDNIRLIVAARANPASIGFSSYIAAFETIACEDDYGMFIRPDANGIEVKIPVSAGVIEQVHVQKPEKLKLDETYEYTAGEDCMIALDGEREISLRSGEKVVFKVTRRGPNRVDVHKALDYAQKKRLFFG